jgi:hypothetical protein
MPWDKPAVPLSIFWKRMGCDETNENRSRPCYRHNNRQFRRRQRAIEQEKCKDSKDSDR